jgi:hypothetical protein
MPATRLMCGCAVCYVRSSQQAHRLWPFVQHAVAKAYTDKGGGGGGGDDDDDDDDDDDEEEEEEEEEGEEEEGEAGDDVDDGTSGGGGHDVVDPSMEVSEWLRLHGLEVEVAALFSAEDVETLEDIALVIAEQGDLELLGVTPAIAAELWPAVRQVLKACGGGGDGGGGRP